MTWDPGPASTDSKKSISWGPRGLPKSLISSPCSMWDMGSLSHRAVLDSGEGISRDVHSKFIVGSEAFPNISIFVISAFIVLIVLLLFLRFDCLRSGDGLADTYSKYSSHYFIVVPICFVVVAFDLDPN